MCCRLVKQGVIAAALVMGAADVAARNPNPLFANMPPGTAIDLGPLECTTPPGMRRCQTITDYSGFVYDRHGHRMVMFGGGHAAVFTDAIWALDLDAARPKWTPLYESTPCEDMTEQNFDAKTGSWKSTGHPYSRHTYDLLVVPDDRNELVLFDDGNGRDGNCVQWVGGYLPGHGKVAIFDFDEGRWELTHIPGVGYPSAAEYDPISQQTIFVGRDGVRRFDHSIRHFSAVAGGFGSKGHSNHLVYFPPNDRFYYFEYGARTRVWEVRLDRPGLGAASVQEIQTSDAPPSRETGYAYDPVRQVIGGNVRDSLFHTFDPIARSWTGHQMPTPRGANAEVGDLTFHAIDFDPVNGVFIFIADGRDGRRTWAFRPAGRG